MFDVEGVVTIGGRGAGNVTVSFALATRRKLPLGRGIPGPVRTDKLGRFAQGGFAEGLVYAVTATSAGVTFQPAKATVDAQHREARFAGTAATFAASGVVRVPAALGQAGKPPGIAGVTIAFVRVSGRTDVAVPAPVTTGTDGTWRQSGFLAGNVYRALPSKVGLAFSPPSVTVQQGASSEFTGSSSVFSVAGRVRTAGGAVEPGVSIGFRCTVGSGSVPPSVTTDGTGSFSQSGFDRASRYRVTPSKPGRRFDPPSRDVAFAPNALPMILADFQRVTNLVVTGQVLTTAGAGLLSTVLTFTRVSGTGAVPLPVTTTSNGEYRAAGLDAGTTYAVTGTREGFGVVPAQLRAAVAGTTTLNLTAFPAFEVAGVVVDSGGAVPDLGVLQQLLAGAAPTVAGALVTFQRRDAGPPAPAAVVTAADGTFRQRGFEVGGNFLAQASAPGFVGAVLIGFLNPFGGSFGDGSSAGFTHDRADLLSGLVLLLMRG